MKILVGVAVLAFAAASGHAQAPAGLPEGALLDAGNIGVTLPKDLKWEGAEGEKRVYLYGNPDKPGPYAVLYRWEPGHNSKPHTHTVDRYAYVISGNWWNSTSPREDKSTLVPVGAGSFVVHKAGQVHWDGGVDGLSYVLVTGIGPINTQRVAGN
jgi:quercetin dioxygenase-like cupin family protein